MISPVHIMMKFMMYDTIYCACVWWFNCVTMFNFLWMRAPTSTRINPASIPLGHGQITCSKAMMGKSGRDDCRKKKGESRWEPEKKALYMVGTSNLGSWNSQWSTLWFCCRIIESSTNHQSSARRTSLQWEGHVIHVATCLLTQSGRKRARASDRGRLTGKHGICLKIL